MNILNLPQRAEASIHSSSSALTGWLLVMLVVWGFFLQLEPAQQQLAGVGVGGVVVGFIGGYLVRLLR